MFNALLLCIRMCACNSMCTHRQNNKLFMHSFSYFSFKHTHMHAYIHLWCIHVTHSRRHVRCTCERYIVKHTTRALPQRSLLLTPSPFPLSLSISLCRLLLREQFPSPRTVAAVVVFRWIPCVPPLRWATHEGVSGSRAFRVRFSHSLFRLKNGKQLSPHSPQNIWPHRRILYHPLISRHDYAIPTAARRLIGII